MVFKIPTVKVVTGFLTWYSSNFLFFIFYPPHFAWLAAATIYSNGGLHAVLSSIGGLVSIAFKEIHMANLATLKSIFKNTSFKN